MSEYTIEIQGLEPIIARLVAPLRPAIEAGALGIAAEAQDRAAPYPPARPRRPGRPYYVRGTGGFTAGGIQISTSETMNRRWNIRPVAFGAVLENRASYASEVIGDRGEQRRIHGRHGWRRAPEEARAVATDGTGERIMTAAIMAVLEGS